MRDILTIQWRKYVIGYFVIDGKTTAFNNPFQIEFDNGNVPAKGGIELMIF